MVGNSGVDDATGQLRAEGAREAWSGQPHCELRADYDSRESKWTTCFEASRSSAKNMKDPKLTDRADELIAIVRLGPLMISGEADC